VSSSPSLHVLRQCFLIFASLAFLPAVAFGQIENPTDGGPPNSQGTSSTSVSLDKTNGTLDDLPQTSVTCGVKHLGQCLKDVGQDQIGILTSPLRLSPSDAFWLVPFAGATGAALHYDAQALQDLGVNKKRIDLSSTFSDVGLYGAMAGDAGLYFLGVATHNEHLAETGRLGAEAVADASLVVEGLKLATNRQRPNEGNGQGDFWPHGTHSFEFDGSFPSEHAAATFALARVIASEYPSKPVQIAAYALALAVSASRVTAYEHFPSDILVGGTLGYPVNAPTGRAGTRAESARRFGRCRAAPTCSG
jgi:membrane-associated phospholipid phosphatase